MEKLLAVLGHLLIIAGCYLFTWGMTLLPVSTPDPAGILSRPLFWGLISIFGGICTMRVQHNIFRKA